MSVRECFQSGATTRSAARRAAVRFSASRLIGAEAADRLAMAGGRGQHGAGTTA